MNVPRDAKVIVTIQPVNFNDVGLDVGKQPLRIIVGAKIAGGGGSILIKSDYGAEPSSFGIAPHDQVWKDGELHLQNIHAQSGQGVSVYDIVLVQSGK